MSSQPEIARAHIDAGAGIVTLINVATVEPSDQQRLVEAWQHAAQEVMCHRSGFVSASIHRSLDGTKVINYAQWENREALAAMFRDPLASRHLSQFADVGITSPVLCEVVSVHTATGS